MRGLPPDVFEVRLLRHHYNDGAAIEVCSRMYDIRLGLVLRRAWGDPRPLAEFIERFVGGTVLSWFESRIGPDVGREMARALLPFWERQIHEQMERFEYESISRHHAERAFDYVRHSRLDDPRLWNIDPQGGWGAPAEDPAAKKKARALLVKNLNDEQKASFEKNGEFSVAAKDGKTYTIKTARSFNVIGPDQTKYCGQLVDTPIEDQMLAQKLLLEHDPQKFFDNANVSPAFDATIPPRMATEIRMRMEQSINMLRRNALGI